jgi:preprotein translocase subunit SecG
MIKLDRKAQSLQLKVQIGSKGSKEAGGAVKDLKQVRQAGAVGTALLLHRFAVCCLMLWLCCCLAMSLPRQ